MLLFPQLSTGATVQYPLEKQLSQRTIRSVMEDGTTIVLADRSAQYVRWRIALRDLSDLEAAAVANFFAETGGNLRPFHFLDPSANLLSWTEDFGQTAWNVGGCSVLPGFADALGGSRAARLINNTSTDQTLAQLTQVPGLAQICFSVYLRASTPTVGRLNRAAGSQVSNTSVDVTSIWKRFSLSSGLAGCGDLSTFGIRIPAGASLEIFGPQVEAQLTPSTYVTNAGQSRGVYANARFDSNELNVVATGPNRSSCVVFVRCNLPSGESS